jgi:hypothetical protein
MKILYTVSFWLGLFIYSAAFSMNIDWSIIRLNMNSWTYSAESIKRVDEILCCEANIAEAQKKLVLLWDGKKDELYPNDLIAANAREVRECINNNIKKKDELIESLIEDINIKKRNKLIAKIMPPKL